jgi:hypothetical protein
MILHCSDPTEGRLSDHQSQRSGKYYKKVRHGAAFAIVEFANTKVGVCGSQVWWNFSLSNRAVCFDSARRNCHK